MSGYLEIILGSMFAGKTTKLIEKYRECNKIKKKVLTLSTLNKSSVSKIKSKLINYVS